MKSITSHIGDVPSRARRPARLPAIGMTLAAVGLQMFLMSSAQAITVDFKVKSTWDSGYGTDVVITNDTSTTISSWTLGFKLGNSITSVWSATKSGSDPYTFVNASFNGEIKAGKSQSFGFNANGVLTAANLGNCTINGTTCRFLINGVAVGGASSSASSSSVPASSSSSKSSSSSSSSSSSKSSASSSTAPSSSSSSKSSSSASSSSTPSSSSSSASSAKLVYRQSFNALSAGLWNNNIDSSKIKAHPENASVTTGCGPDNSNCFRVVYRHADGIHKQPAANPVFTTTSGLIEWTPSGTGITNTATDVTQANIAIDGSTNDLGKASNTPVPGKAYTLSYDVYFEPGFDFAKGGKLPGLAAAAFDSGCTEDGNAKRQNGNWSVRIMWRANGRVELYSYDQTRPSGSCGITRMIDEQAGDPPYEVPDQIPADSKFRFKPGTWYTVRLALKLNDNNLVIYQKDANGKLVLDSTGSPIPTAGNGEVNLAIKSADGSVKRQITYQNVALRDECNGACPASVPDTKSTWINGLFFSTFFGGNEVKRTTCLQPMPSYAGLTQARFDQLCASQKNPAIFPNLTWNPQRPSAARFDNMTVTEGYVSTPF
ncbi:cellulose binding domain-containing protein [Uliginosibacterium sp. H3]|uniref:Cellulose binding domain-containing protein n=1 Tax=Uliginosibacterium silvisoli TaxID=3114758 RepID=A0ABU6K644_9RHOO|nr:cellulose binding domain-containing protein [Uliginosibacterium sp. H3]